MEDWLVHMSYIGVVAVLLIAGLGVPLPEDVPLIIAGVISALYPDHANIWVMVPVCFGAVIGADLMIFTMGRLHGERLRKLPLLRRYISDERLAKVSEAYHDHVGKTLFSARFMPGLRTPLFFTAGSIGIKYWRMILFDGVAALISVPALVLAGYFGAGHKDLVLRAARDTQLGVGGIVLVLFGGFILYRWLRKRRQRPSTDAS